ncbi:MAG: quinoprotein relay system zinc metallohydrolase 1 [Pseudomonadota bacterium]
MTNPTFLNRRTVLKTGLACATVTMSMPAVAKTYGLAPKQIDAGVWLIEGAQDSFAPSNGGAICNIVLLETTDGAIVVDTGSTAKMGASIRAFADEQLGGVAMTLITHNHPDHWFGNLAFKDRPILSLPACAAQCDRNAEGYSEALYHILGSWMSGTTPVIPQGTLEGGDITVGGRRLTLVPMSGHSDADLVIIDPATGVLIAGDLLFLDRAATFPDADVPTWLNALDQLQGLNFEGVVPGHGAFHRSSAALVQTRNYLVATDARLRLAAELGLSPMEAMIAGPVPGTETLGANPEEYRRSVVQSWTGYEQKALPLVHPL